MLEAGTITNALLALAGWLAAGTLFGAAMIWFALWVSDVGKVRTAANSVGGLRRESGRQSSVTNAYKTIQTNQTNSTSKPRIKSGQGGR